MWKKCQQLLAFFYIYKQDKFHAQLSWPSKRVFILLCWCSGMSVYSLGARMILLVLFMRGHTDDWVGLVKAHRRLRVVKRCFRKIESSPCYLYYCDRKARSAALNYLCFESAPQKRSQRSAECNMSLTGPFYIFLTNGIFSPSNLKHNF